MLTVVPDVNVLVSSLIKQRGPIQRIQAAWEADTLLFVTSEPIIAKTDEVLHREKITSLFSTPELAEERIQRFLAALRRRAVQTPHQLDLRVVEKDPEDDTIIIAAVEGNADCIISGDAHLKNLGDYENIPILTPAEFVTQYNIP